jgi:hypothetical protein
MGIFLQSWYGNLCESIFKESGTLLLKVIIICGVIFHINKIKYVQRPQIVI